MHAILGIALFAFIAELIFELIFELVGQIIVELFGELLRKIFSDPGVRTALPWVAAVFSGLGTGVWRGSLADELTWGLVAAFTIAVIATVAALWFRPTGSPPNSVVRRVFVWWPAKRSAWFAAFNLCFVIGYLLAA
jgi:hypothetical protein